MSTPDETPIDAALQRALSARLKIALRAAEEAGAILMAHFGHLETVDNKSPIDLVTVADQQSEAQILGELRAAFSGDTFLAEEQDGPGGAAAMAAEVPALPFCWAIDPLDGTTNYAHGHLNFAASIGLLHHGRPVLGVVLAPARREVFVGGLGIRATCNGRPLSVSRVETLSASLLATGFPYDRRTRIAQLQEWVGRALMQAHGLRRGGSAAIDLCEVAAGRLDGFFEINLAPWDITAGHAIVEAAGGRVTDFGGGRHDVFGRQTLASNGRVHAALAEMVVSG